MILAPFQRVLAVFSAKASIALAATFFITILAPNTARTPTAVIVIYPFVLSGIVPLLTYIGTTANKQQW